MHGVVELYLQEKKDLLEHRICVSSISYLSVHRKCLCSQHCDSFLLKSPKFLSRSLLVNQVIINNGGICIFQDAELCCVPVPCACPLLNMAELTVKYFLRTYLPSCSWIWTQLMLLQLAGNVSCSSLQCQSPFGEQDVSRWLG